MESSFCDSTLRYGFDHVLDGADHLLFLLTLLLPAPLIAVHHRWQSSPGVWRAWKKVIHVATAFTIGHSISLAASAFGVVSVPVRLVEIVIGVSVGVSALHAIRPLASRGEVPIAVGFGLIDGLAFAEILNNFGLDDANMMRTLLAFNLGVELAQLMTIAFVFPSLWLLSRTRCYPAMRIIGAGFALALSVGWVLERLDLVANPLAPIESGAVANLIPVALVLAALGVVCRLADRPTESLGGEQ